jgi:hypothetical protein
VTIIAVREADRRGPGNVMPIRGLIRIVPEC